MFELHYGSYETRIGLTQVASMTTLLPSQSYLAQSQPTKPDLISESFQTTKHGHPLSKFD